MKVSLRRSPSLLQSFECICSLKGRVAICPPSDIHSRAKCCKLSCIHRRRLSFRHHSLQIFTICHHCKHRSAVRIILKSCCKKVHQCSRNMLLNCIEYSLLRTKINRVGMLHWRNSHHNLGIRSNLWSVREWCRGRIECIKYLYKRCNQDWKEQPHRPHMMDWEQQTLAHTKDKFTQYKLHNWVHMASRQFLKESSQCYTWCKWEESISKSHNWAWGLDRVWGSRDYRW